MRLPPIRTDGSNAFAHYSMSVRVPKILHQVLEHNPDYPEELVRNVVALATGIRESDPLPELSLPAPDWATWEAALRSHAGETWLDTDWLFAECYVYRCLLDAVRYWETGRDPFASVKRTELNNQGLWERVGSAQNAARAARPAERLRAALAASLWGNRVDLSYAVGVAFGASGDAGDLLSDDRGWAIESLLSAGRDGGDVHVVLDNTGSELAFDLALVDAILGCLSGYAPAGDGALATPGRVVLHAKMAPTFVSDATVGDVHLLMAELLAQGGACTELGERLQSAFTSGTLRLYPDFFWNGPADLSQLPVHLVRPFERARLVVLKGDANYRRATGDALFPTTTPFAEVTRYSRAPWLALRTLKSDSVVGLPAGVRETLDSVDPNWRINGRRGVIQGTGQR